jgi:nucleotide-binding universal stress UspA family protein
MSEIRTILVPLDDAAIERKIFERALKIGRHFDAAVEALHVSPLPRPSDPGWEALTKRGMGFAVTEDAMREAKRAEERIRAAFDSICKSEGVAEETPPEGTNFTARFAVAGGTEELVVATRARISDLVVTSRGSAEGEVSETIEAVLTEGGRPVLVLPRGDHVPLQGTCVVAWNGRPEAARAVSFALPFLKAAAQTIVLEVDDAGSRRGLSAKIVAQYLASHGVAARDQSTRKSGTIGTTLVRAARDNQANLLVMGGAAYSRLRRMIFGGVTRDVIEKTDIPVLMAN